jgi:hypothetical protein
LKFEDGGHLFFHMFVFCFMEFRLLIWFSVLGPGGGQCVESAAAGRGWI